MKVGYGETKKQRNDVFLTTENELSWMGRECVGQQTERLLGDRGAQKE